jgi:hypothetical protein
MIEYKDAFKVSILSIGLFGLGYIVKKGMNYIVDLLNKKEKHIKTDIIDMMRNTPLIYIKSLSDLTGCKIYGKCEHMLPFTSKDRMIKNIILDAKAYL